MALTESIDQRPLLLVDAVAVVVSLVLGTFLLFGFESASLTLGTASSRSLDPVGSTGGDGLVAFSVAPGVRAVVALLFVTFVPGWTALRLAGFGLHSMTFVGAFVLSITVMIAISVPMSTLLGWPWRTAGLGCVSACVVGLVVAMRRTRQGRQPRGWSP